MDTIHPYSFEVEASELPERVRAQFPERKRFVVEISPAESEEEKFLAVKKGIDQGLADSKAGRTHDADEVLAWLKKEIFPA
jgi:predicted transcriptional regulator